MAETSARGPRIAPEAWQVLLGVGAGGSPGPKPPEKRSANPCEDCGLALHAHDKERVYTGDGHYHEQRVCPMP